MESTPILFKYLGFGLHTYFEENKLKYKHFFVEESAIYRNELEIMFDDFRLEFQKDKNEIDLFDLVNQINNIIYDLTVFYYEEIEYFKPYITELPEFAEFERLEKKKYRDNQLHLLDPVVKYEIKIAKKVKNFIVKHRPSISAHATKQVLPLKERVIFEGEQSSLISLIYLLQLINKFTFNKENKYSTSQLHLEDFLNKNFAYKKGVRYEAVKYAGKAISDLRNHFTNTADVSKKNVITIINDSILFFEELKEKVNNTDLRSTRKEK